MAEVNSTFLLQPGASAPHFILPDPSGNHFALSDLIEGKKGILIAFVCNHCPFVVHLADALGQFSKEVADLGIGTVAISSNDFSRYPADAPEHMTTFAASHGWNFPYLYDENQSVARDYAAACTPDFYLFDANLQLQYAGQFDDSRPSRGSASGHDLRRAAEDLIAERPSPPPWYPSSGCSIKWKTGNEPEY